MSRKNSLLFVFICLILAGIASFLFAEKAKTEMPAEKPACTEHVIWRTEGIRTGTISFSHDSGTFVQPSLSVVLSTSADYTIACTTDGTVPSRENDSGCSSLTVSIERQKTGYLSGHRNLMLLSDFGQTGFYEDDALPSGIVLTVILIDSEGRLSEPVSKVYFPGVDFEESFPGCLIISLVADPDDLLDYYRGILATGAVYDRWKQTDEAKKIIAKVRYYEAETNSTQRGKNWERPVVFQMYDSGDVPVLECGAGIRVRGGISRTTVQKSFNLYFRDIYGASALAYDLFPDNPGHQSISLKIGGNSLDSVKYKDVLVQSLTDSRNYMVLNTRPAVLFLNGEYWGPYLLQEKISAYLIHNRTGAETDRIVVIKDASVEEGKISDIGLYEELMSFSEQDLSDPEVYREFCDVMDISSMADYFAARIYIGDADWSYTKNDVLWRTRDHSFNSGRWQYILYDTDFSCGLYGVKSSSETTDHFQKAINDYPLFAAAVKNKEFFDLFLSSIKEIGADCYSPENVIREKQILQTVWDPLMHDFYIRYGDFSAVVNEESERMIEFFSRRYDIIIPLIEEWGAAEFEHFTE